MLLSSGLEGLWTCLQKTGSDGLAHIGTRRACLSWPRPWVWLWAPVPLPDFCVGRSVGCHPGVSALAQVSVSCTHSHGWLTWSLPWLQQLLRPPHEETATGSLEPWLPPLPSPQPGPSKGPGGGGNSLGHSQEAGSWRYFYNLLLPHLGTPTDSEAT